MLTSRGHQELVGWMGKSGEAQLLNACLFILTFVNFCTMRMYCLFKIILSVFVL